MKKNNISHILIACATLLVMGGMFNACSKSNNSGTKTTPPPSNPGGYDSSNQIQSSALVAYWGFNGNFDESKHNLVATTSSTAPTFTAGIKGQAYQGSGSSYLTVALGSSASLFAATAFPSYTVSLWVNEPAEPIYAPSGNYTPGQGPEGLFFMYDAAGHQDLLHMDIEPYDPTIPQEDTMSINAGFTITGATTTGPYVGAGGIEGVVPNGHLDTAINQWTEIVMTYDGTSSEYTLYENGTAVGANSAWSAYANISPIQILTGGLTSGYGSAPVAGAIPLGSLNYTPAPTGFVIGAWCGTAGVGGFTPNQYTGSFKGALDELRVYNVALDASDVKSLYLLEKAGF